MKNILILDGHPDSESLCTSMASTYYTGAKNAGFETRLIRLGDLDFNPNLQFGYRIRTKLEPDLLETIEYMNDADHMVLVYPTWWGTYPALVKGFIDRTFLPGITFKPGNGLKWDKLLKGKTGRIITTMDAPLWYNSLFYKSPGHNAVKKATLQYCGVKKVGITAFSPIKSSTADIRKIWLTKVEQLGIRGK